VAKTHKRKRAATADAADLETGRIASLAAKSGSLRSKLRALASFKLTLRPIVLSNPKFWRTVAWEIIDATDDSDLFTPGQDLETFIKGPSAPGVGKMEAPRRRGRPKTLTSDKWRELRTALAPTDRKCRKIFAAARQKGLRELLIRQTFEATVADRALENPLALRTPETLRNAILAAQCKASPRMVEEFLRCELREMSVNAVFRDYCPPGTRLHITGSGPTLRMTISPPDGATPNEIDAIREMFEHLNVGTVAVASSRPRPRKTHPKVVAR